MRILYTTEHYNDDTVKSGKIKEIKITADDLKSICFPASKEGFIIRNTRTHIKCYHTFFYNNDFRYFVKKAYRDVNSIFFIETYGVTTATDDMIRSAKTVEDLFHEGLEYLIQNNNPYYGKGKDYLCEDSSWMKKEIYGMQDALLSARQISSSSDPEILFEHFCRNLHPWWVADLVGFTKAKEMQREFFDKMLPIMENKEKIKITADDLKSICFPSDSSFILGKTLFQFSSASVLFCELKDIVNCIADPEADAFEDFICASIKPASDEEIKTAKSIETVFHEALSLLLSEKEMFLGGIPIYYFGDDAPFMSREVCYMMEELIMAYRYAEDLDNTEKIFNVFSNCLAYTWCENPDYWWITDLCGPEKALEMEREFFDALSSVAITGRYEECSEEYSLDEEDCLLW